MLSPNIKHIVIASISLLFASCEDLNTTSIPDASVYLEQTINSEAIELRTIGGFKTYTETTKYDEAFGYGGLLVIYGFNQEYYAFDLACPYEIDRDIQVVPNSSGQAVCPICGSVFSIGYGSGNRLSGPAEEGLRKYNVYTYEKVSGTTIRVTR